MVEWRENAKKVKDTTVSDFQNENRIQHLVKKRGTQFTSSSIEMEVLLSVS